MSGSIQPVVKTPCCLPLSWFFSIPDYPCSPYNFSHLKLFRVIQDFHGYYGSKNFALCVCLTRILSNTFKQPQKFVVAISHLHLENVMKRKDHPAREVPAFCPRRSPRCLSGEALGVLSLDTCIQI